MEDEFREKETGGKKKKRRGREKERESESFLIIGGGSLLKARDYYMYLNIQVLLLL